MPTEQSDRPETEGQASNGAEQGTERRVSRRRTLRLGGFAGVAGLVGAAGLDTGRMNEPRGDDEGGGDEGGGDEKTADVVHLEYDEYDDWRDAYWSSNGHPDNASLVSSPTDTGDTALQLQITEGGNWGVSLQYSFDDGLLELNGRVQFALDADWEMPGRDPSNCRLWNCAMALGEGSAGGGIPTGTNGWSNRLYVSTKDTDADGPFHLLSFTYHMDATQDHDYLVDGEPYTIEEAKIVPGEWYEFEYYVRANTVSDGTANDDGVVQYWLDGDRIYDRQNLRFTTDLEKNVINTAGPVGHYGGRYVAPQDLYAYFDGHSMVPDGTFE